MAANEKDTEKAPVQDADRIPPKDPDQDLAELRKAHEAEITKIREEMQKEADEKIAAAQAESAAQVEAALARVDALETDGATDTIKALQAQYKGTNISVDPNTGALSARVDAPKK